MSVARKIKRKHEQADRPKINWRSQQREMILHREVARLRALVERLRVDLAEERAKPKAEVFFK